MKTIESLFEEDKIDTVYVRYAYEDVDRMIDCHQPWNMIDLERLMREQSPRVVGWKFLHNHRLVDQEEIDGKESEYLGAGWKRDYLNEYYYKMIAETPHGD